MHAEKDVNFFLCNILDKNPDDSHPRFACCMIPIAKLATVKFTQNLRCYVKVAY